MITAKDKVIIEFIANIHCYSNTINEMFYPDLKSQRYCNSRLSFLHEYGYIKRNRKHASEFYFYWTGKGKREPADKYKRHYDLIARAYIWVLKHDYNILDVDVQSNMEMSRPDLLLHIEKEGKRKIYCQLK